jgi:hypothetical protein
MSLYANTAAAQLYQPSFFAQESPTQLYLKQLQSLMNQSNQQNASNQMVSDAYKFQLMFSEYKSLLGSLNELDSETRKQFGPALDFVLGKVGQFLRHRTLKKMLNAFRAMKQLKYKIKKVNSNSPRRTRYPLTVSSPLRPTPALAKRAMLTPLNGLLSHH